MQHVKQVLVAEELRKSYGRREAVRGLSFSLQAGTLLGFLGPNGAGKTTSIRMLTTILAPDSGRFVVDGTSSEDPQRIRRKIGVLPETFGLPKHLTGIEFLTYFGRLYGRPAAEARANGLALLEEVGLGQRARSLVSTYSHGMRQRLGIARALVNNPVVVFLDEPTLGLDPRGQEELLGLVRQVARERNAGVILCSHLLWEIERICDEVVILRQGQVVASGSVAEVMGQRSGIRIQVPTSFIEQAQRVLDAVPDVMKTTIDRAREGWLAVELVDSSGRTPSDSQLVNNWVLGALIRAEIPIINFEAGAGRLQDVFLQLTEGAIA